MTPYLKIAESIDYLVAHAQDRPDLAVLAARAGYDPAHFQRLFSDYTGISPKRMIQHMNARHASELLRAGASTLDAALEAGLSGNGRLHDLMLRAYAASPGQVKTKGAGMVIRYGFCPTPLGEAMIGLSEHGICWLGFVMEGDRAEPLRRMYAFWSGAQALEDDGAIFEAGESIAALWGPQKKPRPFRLEVKGTNFQLQVWRALLEIPYGETVTYQDIARRIGRPAASRAVGNAVGANPVSLLIPCHRVIRASGIIDNYGWGSPRKKLILGAEQHYSGS